MRVAELLLERLVAREPIEEPVALLVAHPDDETIGAGAVLPLFRRLVLVHVTDGAPRNLADARAYGFEDAAGYAAARQAELDCALRAAGVSPVRVALGAADQGASGQMVALAHALREVLARFGAVAVLTHPYEGGHPDHDAAAFIAAHSGVPVIEFASYHAAPEGGLAVGRFLENPPPLVGGAGGGVAAAQTSRTPHPSPQPPPTRGGGVLIALSPAEQRRKRAMLDCFATQAATLAPFGIGHELFRLAPSYDFTQPPHPGTLNYDRYDWGMTGARWRTLAAEANAQLC